MILNRDKLRAASRLRGGSTLSVSVMAAWACSCDSDIIIWKSRLSLATIGRIPRPPYSIHHCMTRPCRGGLPCLVASCAWKIPASPASACLLTPLAFPLPARASLQSALHRPRIQWCAIFYSSGTCRTCGRICTVALDLRQPCCNRRCLASLHFPMLTSRTLRALMQVIKIGV